MKYLTLSLLIIAVVLSLPGTKAVAQTPKIGYVNSSKILLEFAEAQDAQRKIDDFQKRITDSLDIFQQEYQSRLKEYQQKEAMMNDQAKKSAQQELILLEQRYGEFRERKLSRDGELAMYTAKLLDPIKDKVLKIIAQVAKDEKLTFVFDKTEAIQILLYGDQKYDYTNLIIDRLKRGKVSGN